MKMRAGRRILPIAAAAMVAALSLTGATYAWFTMNSTVNATGMSMQVGAPINFLISQTGEEGTYSDTMTVTVNVTGKLMPSSSTTGQSIYHTNGVVADEGSGFYGAPTTDASIVATTQEAGTGTDGYFVDYDFWLKNTSEEDVGIHVSDISITDPAEGVPDITPAVRFAILERTVDQDPETPDTIAAFAGAGVYSKRVATDPEMYFNDPSDTEAPYTRLLGAISSPSAGNANAYKGTATTVNSPNSLFTLNHDTTQALTVRVWIEGQDSTCVTNNANASFALSFRLTVNNNPNLPS